MSARMPVWNVAGSGNPPENVMTSVAPASDRIAVISEPPSACVRRASRSSQSRLLLALLPQHCGHRRDSPSRRKSTLDIGILQL